MRIKAWYYFVLWKYCTWWVKISLLDTSPNLVTKGNTRLSHTASQPGKLKCVLETWKEFNFFLCSQKWRNWIMDHLMWIGWEQCNQLWQKDTNNLSSAYKNLNSPFRKCNFCRSCHCTWSNECLKIPPQAIKCKFVPGSWENWRWPGMTWWFYFIMLGSRYAFSWVNLVFFWTQHCKV